MVNWELVEAVWIQLKWYLTLILPVSIGLRIWYVDVQRKAKKKK